MESNSTVFVAPTPSRIAVWVPTRLGPFSVGQVVLERGGAKARVYEIHEEKDDRTQLVLIVSPPGAYFPEFG